MLLRTLALAIAFAAPAAAVDLLVPLERPAFERGPCVSSCQVIPCEVTTWEVVSLSNGMATWVDHRATSRALPAMPIYQAPAFDGCRVIVCEPLVCDHWVSQGGMWVEAHPVTWLPLIGGASVPAFTASDFAAGVTLRVLGR